MRGRDMVGFEDEAKRQIAAKVHLPPGRYHIEYGGQFEHNESARQRLTIVIPLAIISIFVLLYMTY